MWSITLMMWWCVGQTRPNIMSSSQRSYKVRAITEMPRHQNVADVRCFLGIVTYMSKFLPFFTDTTKPLCDLLAKESDWLWAVVEKVKANG